MNTIKRSEFPSLFEDLNEISYKILKNNHITTGTFYREEIFKFDEDDEEYYPDIQKDMWNKLKNTLWKGSYEWDEFNAYDKLNTLQRVEEIERTELVTTYSYEDVKD